jgi:acyl-coenzyme A thioesterase 9
LEQYPWKESPNKKINFFENSYARFTLPLSSSLRLREKLNKLFDQEVRTGKIFELMDSMAGIVSYSHCFAPLTSSISNRDMICVTGSVESLHLFDKINISEDLLMEGYLNHVGKTSMEIEINVLQEGKLKANSLFTMVARDAKNPEKGYQVPQLSFDNLEKEEKQKALTRHEAAKVNLIMRKEEMAASYDKTPPTP